jgi:hypothetical protein
VLIRELLRENSDVVDDISNDLMDIIVTYRTKNVGEAPMQGADGVVSYLNRLGYTVDANDVMELLSKPPFDEVVERSDPEKIKLKTSIPEPKVGDDQMEKSREKIAKIAGKAATKAVKSGDAL